MFKPKDSHALLTASWLAHLRAAKVESDWARVDQLLADMEGVQRSRGFETQRSGHLGLTEDGLRAAAANFGVDLSCGSCSALFFTGYGGYEHDKTCVTFPSKMGKEQFDDQFRLGWFEGVADAIAALAEPGILGQAMAIARLERLRTAPGEPPKASQAEVEIGDWRVAKTSCHCNREDDGHGWAVLYKDRMVRCLGCLRDSWLLSTTMEPDRLYLLALLEDLLQSYAPSESHFRCIVCGAHHWPVPEHDGDTTCVVSKALQVLRSLSQKTGE